MAIVLVVVVAFALGFVGSIPLAGPIAVLVVSRAGTGRFRGAIELAAGAAVAEGIYAGVAFWGFATLLGKHAAALPIAHAITAVVLLGVGGYFIRWRPPSGDAKEETRRRREVWIGFTAAIANPTLFVTWSAVTTALYARGIVEMKGLYAIPFGAAAACGIVSWFVALVALMKRFHHKLPQKTLTWVVRGMGLLLIAIALASAVDLVRKLAG